jgi:hypothetical protein
MQSKREFQRSRIGDSVFGSVLLLAALTACSRDQPPQTVAAVQPPQPAAVAQPATVVEPAAVAQPTVVVQPTVMVQPAPPPPQVVQVQADVMMPDDYVYYPQYEVYYSASRSQFGYWDGGAWLWRPSPPNVAANVLFASASVRMDFHDSPALHRESVARSYPRNWSAPAKEREVRSEHNEAQHDDHNERR